MVKSTELSRPEKLIRRNAVDIKKPLTEEQQHQVAALVAMPDFEINYEDIPPLTDEQLARMTPLRARSSKDGHQ